MLRENYLRLPAKGRGGSTWPPPPPAQARTDNGTARQERGLKHRAAHETRTIPIRRAPGAQGWPTDRADPASAYAAPGRGSWLARARSRPMRNYLVC